VSRVRTLRRWLVVLVLAGGLVPAAPAAAGPATIPTAEVKAICASFHGHYDEDADRYGCAFGAGVLDCAVATGECGYLGAGSKPLWDACAAAGSTLKEPVPDRYACQLKDFTVVVDCTAADEPPPGCPTWHQPLPNTPPIR
jgi:hypothetical protein